MGVLLALILLAALIVTKRNIRKKRWAMLGAALLCAALVSVLSIYPPGNLFLKFDSPEAVSRYRTAEKQIATIQGEHSALVLGQNRKGWDFCLVPMRDGMYQIPGMTHVKRVGESYNDDRVIYLYRDRKSRDLYFFGFLWGNEIPEEITDSLGYKVQIWEEPATGEGIQTLYFYGAVPSNAQTYFLEIGGGGRLPAGDGMDGGVTGDEAKKHKPGWDDENLQRKSGYTPVQGGFRSRCYSAGHDL